MKNGQHTEHKNNVKSNIYAYLAQLYNTFTGEHLQTIINGVAVRRYLLQTSPFDHSVVWNTVKQSIHM